MDKTVRVCQVENETEANLICSVLDKDKIPYTLKMMGDSAYDGLYVMQGPWGFLEGPASYADRISQVVKDLRESQPVGDRHRAVERRESGVGIMVIVAIIIVVAAVSLAVVLWRWVRYGNL
jgi:hypothetical protein